MYLYDIFVQRLDDRMKVNLFYIDEKRNVIIKEDFLNYSLKIRKFDYDALKLNLKINNIYKNYDNEDVIEIVFDSKDDYDEIFKLVKDKNIRTYENDLLPEVKYLIDNNVKIKESNKDFLPFKEAYIDIETSKNETILLISLYSQSLKKVWVLDNNFKKNISKEKYDVEFFQSEEDLLENFRDTLIKYNFNLILGWNVIDFDFKIIINRFKYYDLEFKLNNFGYNCSLRINKDYFKESKLSCPGTLVLDAIFLLRANNISFPNYKLDTVAFNVLGDEKYIYFDENENKTEIIENLYNNKIEELIEYNFKDSELVYKIVKKLKLLELIYEKTIISETPIFKVRSPITILDVLYLKRLHKKNLVASTIYNFSDRNGIVGGYVMNPIKGFHNNVLVFDFKSLYPSIIMTFNIDPFTYVSDKKTKNLIEAPNGAYFKREKGILPSLIEKIYNERNKAKKKGDKIKSYSLKTLINSFYGAVGSPKCRFYNKNVAEAITSFGHFFIKLMRDYFEKEGFKVIYGDTDSLFVKISGDFDESNILDFGRNLENKANKFLKDYIKKNYNLESKLILEFEKVFLKFFIASKKRYVGKTLEDKVKFTGLEAVRGDWTKLAKNFQIEFIKRVFNGDSKEDLKNFIKNFVKELKEGKFDDYLIYTKKITKLLEQYTKTTPPHVKAARQLKDFKGKVVEYVITKEGPLHKSLINKNTRYDYDHYIQKQLKAVIDDFIEYLDINFEETISGEKQNTLEKFF